MDRKKSILLLFDGSENSAQISNYGDQLSSFKNGHVVLFHVLNPLPECFWDMQRIPQTQKSISELLGWEERQKTLIDTCSQNICQNLLQMGFTKDQIEVKIQKRKSGIARDILEETKKGKYQAVALQRRGQSKAQTIKIGSVANKLFLNLHYCPLLITGNTSFRKKLLIAIDGSLSSLQAVDFIIDHLSPEDASIGLIHVIRGIEDLTGPSPGIDIPSTFLEAAQSAMNNLLYEIKEKFVQAGFAGSHVETKIITGVRSRAEAIRDTAVTEGYDTIVIGRKGISQIQDFSMGRVCSKIIQISESLNVWVI